MDKSSQNLSIWADLGSSDQKIIDKYSQNMSIWTDLGSSDQKIIDKYSQNLSIWAVFGQIGQISDQILARLARFGSIA